jgi:hypothetical protein
VGYAFPTFFIALGKKVEEHYALSAVLVLTILSVSTLLIFKALRLNQVLAITID